MSWEAVVRSAAGDVEGGTVVDRGQAAVMVVTVAAALFVVAVVALVTVGRHTLDQARAQTAADSAALGALGGGRGVAAELADEHGAELVEFRVAASTGVVTVIVRVGARSAAASAGGALELP